MSSLTIESVTIKSATIEPATIESESRPKSGAFERVAALLRRQRREKLLHGRALLARGHQREIIMLFGKRNETEARACATGAMVMPQSARCCATAAATALCERG